MNFEMMSEALQKAIMRAVELAKDYRHPTIDTPHMLKALFESETLSGLFQRLQIDPNKALTMIDEELKRIASSSQSNPNFSNEALKSFDQAAAWAKEQDETYLSCASVWIAFLFNRSYLS